MLVLWTVYSQVLKLCLIHQAFRMPKCVASGPCIIFRGQSHLLFNWLEKSVLWAIVQSSGVFLFILFSFPNLHNFFLVSLSVVDVMRFILRKPQFYLISFNFWYHSLTWWVILGWWIIIERLDLRFFNLGLVFDLKFDLTTDLNWWKCCWLKFTFRNCLACPKYTWQIMSNYFTPKKHRQIVIRL